MGRKFVFDAFPRQGPPFQGAIENVIVGFQQTKVTSRRRARLRGPPSLVRDDRAAIYVAHRHEDRLNHIADRRGIAEVDFRKVRDQTISLVRRYTSWNVKSLIAPPDGPAWTDSV